jgi:hypothetical protein
MAIITYGGGGGADKKIQYLPYQVGSLVYSGNPQSPSWAGYDPSKMEISGVVSSTNAGTYTATFTPASGIKWWDNTSGAKTATWTIGKAVLPPISFSPSSIVIEDQLIPVEVTVTREGDGAISAVSSDESVATVSVSNNVVSVTGAGSDGPCTLTVNVAAGTNYLAGSASVTVNTDYLKVYGVTWDGTSTTKWARTDAAVGFTDPVPYVAGASSYGSPFDNIYPWSGMVRVSDPDGGEMVAIPKFWYQLYNNGNALVLKISNKKQDGFYTSPMHCDRGDGYGERDIAYVGRYLSAQTTYKSTSGSQVQTKFFNPDARTYAHSLGSEFWANDMLSWYTIWFLYLVEYADWDSQKVIGGGVGAGGAARTGYTDAMPYHTGTTLSSRSSYGCCTQYRNIEGLWDNYHELIGGIRNKHSSSSSTVYLIPNPIDYVNDYSSGGISFYTNAHSSYPTAFRVNTVAGCPLFYPSTKSSSEVQGYTTDYWVYGSSSLFCSYGMWYYTVAERKLMGLFALMVNSEQASSSYQAFRIMKLPNN